MNNFQARKLKATIRLESLMNLEKTTFILLIFLRPLGFQSKQEADLLKK